MPRSVPRSSRGLAEPVSALDIRHQLGGMQIGRRPTRERALTTVVVLHDLNIGTRFSDRIAVKRGGRLICHGGPDVVIRTDMSADVFGVEAALASAPDGSATVTPPRAV